MNTYKQFIERNHVDCEVKRVPFRTDNTEWQADARHFMYTISIPTAYGGNGKKIQGYYSQGSAHTKLPTCEDILNALALDTNCIESTSFDSWCGEFGYDTYSRKAYQTYEACMKEYKQLEQVFSRKQLEELYSCEAL